MTLWVIACANGQELNVQEQVEALGLECAVPRKVELIRQGKRRYPDAVVSAYLPGYAFAWFDADDWHAIRGAKHVRTMMGVTAQSERMVRAFIDRVEDDFAERMAQIEAGERISEYLPGDLLQIIAGPFAGQLARFARILETAHDVFPVIEAELELMGITTRVKVDPIAAKRSTA